MGLDLYAKVEELIGFKEASQYLKSQYLNYIKELNPQNVLDIGCGKGDFIEELNRLNIDSIGVDLSPKMVEIANSKGLDNIFVKSIYQIDREFEVIVAIGDVLNYLDSNELKKFLKRVQTLLKSGGYFLADINSYFGFSEVADGTLVRDFESRFLAIDATFEDEILKTKFNLFEKSKNGEYSRESGEITQYFHSIEKIYSSFNLELTKELALNLYSEDESDKSILIFKKV